ncbi:unnamed protein product [Blepharisma stoltei]|uniref:Uncharacterized protein n=1 Tax=Blepharisma stoltei TaxID=1481888 RepID=A0AAU9JWF2_9CILI|nr:unnamed protein product [Blepharisma stoltei]
MSRRFLEEWDSIILEHSANFKSPSIPNSRNSTCTVTSEENFDTKFPDWELINDKTFSRLQSLLEEQDRAYLDKKTIQQAKRILMADKDIPIEAANSLIHTIENLISQEKKYLNQRKSDLSLISTHPTTPKSTFSPFSAGTPIEMWDEPDKEKEELYIRFKNLYDFLVFLYHQQTEKRNSVRSASIQADLKTQKPMDLSVKDLIETDIPRCSRYSQTVPEPKDNSIYNKAAKLEQDNIALISQNSDLKENLEIMQFELKNTIKLLEKCKKFKIKTEELMNDLDEELKSIKESLENQEVGEEEYWCGVSEIIGNAVDEFNEANEEYEEESNYEAEIESKKDEIIGLLQNKVEELTEVSKGYKEFSDKLAEEHQYLLEKMSREVNNSEIQCDLEKESDKPIIDNSKELLEKDKKIEKLVLENTEISQKYTFMQRELEEMKKSNEVYQKQLQHKEEDYKNLSISLASIRQDLSNRIKSEEDLLAENKLLSSQVKALRESMPEKNDKVKVHLLECENESMSRQIAALTKSNSALQESNANLSAILSDSKGKTKSFAQTQEEINILKKKLKEKTDDSKRIQSRIKLLEEERSNMKKQLDLQKEIEEETKSSKDLALKQKSQMKRMKEKCDFLETENKKLAENSNLSQEQINELKLQIAKLEKTVIGKDKVILDFDKKMSILQIDINNKTDLIDELKDKINQKNEGENDLQEEIDRLKEEINKLKSSQAPLHKSNPESEDHAYFEEWLSTIR